MLTGLRQREAPSNFRDLCAMHERVDRLERCSLWGAGMRGIAHSSMTSLDGNSAASFRDREAAAKARASLDFSSLSGRAGKGVRLSPSQRAQSADIPAKMKHAQSHQQVQTVCSLHPDPLLPFPSALDMV